jgi:hypothetical protein
MDNDYKTEQEQLMKIVESHHYAIACLISLIRNRIEMEAEFWNGLRKSLEGVK